MKVWDRAGIELATPGTAVRHASVARHAAVSTALSGPVYLSVNYFGSRSALTQCPNGLECKTSPLVRKKLNSIYIVCIHIHEQDYTCVDCMHTYLVGLEAAYILSSMGSKDIGETT